MKSKVYSNPPRKPMMYGGMTMKPKAETMGDKIGMRYGGMSKKGKK